MQNARIRGDNANAGDPYLPQHRDATQKVVAKSVTFTIYQVFLLWIPVTSPGAFCQSVSFCTISTSSV